MDEETKKRFLKQLKIDNSDNITKCESVDMFQVTPVETEVERAEIVDNIRKLAKSDSNIELVGETKGAAAFKVVTPTSVTCDEDGVFTVKIKFPFAVKLSEPEIYSHYINAMTSDILQRYLVNKVPTRQARQDIRALIRKGSNIMPPTSSDGKFDA